MRLQFMKRVNWQIWAGFVLSLVAGFSYPFVFVGWPITREFPWANLILFAIAMVLLFLGLRRAFKPDKGIVSKIFSSLAAAFGLMLLAGLLFVVSSPARGCLHRLQPHRSDRRRPTSLSLIRTISKSRWLNCWLSQLTTSRLKACCSFSTAAIGEGCVTPSCGVSKRI